MNPIRASNILRQRATSTIVLLAALAAPLHAQDSTVSVQEEAVVTDADSTVAAAAAAAAATVRPSFYSVPRFIQDMRRTLGFSVRAYGSYDPSAAASTAGQPSGATKSVWVTPQLFANIRGKRSQTYLNYSFDVRAQSGTDQLRGSSHTGSVRFTRPLSRRATFALTESLTSALNDRRTFVGTESATSHQPTAPQDLDVAGQRVTQNTLSANISYLAGRRLTLDFSGEYFFSHYGSDDIGDAHGISVGIASGLKINRWLYLENGYSHYLDLSQSNPAGKRTSQIHRLQVGGLRLARSRSRSISGWEASVSGGMDISITGVRPQVVPSFQTALGKRSDSNQFSLTYRRGLWAVWGRGTTLDGDTVTATFSQAVRRINATIGASYRRGAGSESAVDFATVSAQVGFAIQRHLMVTADYWYVTQRVNNLDAYSVTGDRYRVGAGITYVLPSLFNR